MTVIQNLYTMKTDLEVPEGIQVSIEGNKIKVRKNELELVRIFPPQSIEIKVEETLIKVNGKFETAKIRALVGTFRAHIKNMIKGLGEQFVYKLKICSVHFPMSVKLTGSEFQISNFLGEKRPRNVTLPLGVEVNIDGALITISSADKELAGLAAGKIEQATRLNNKDRRVFQDGIFMIEKAGKVIE